VVSVLQVTPHKNYIRLFSLRRATCPTHLILFDLVTLTICGDECTFWSSSPFGFCHPPVTSFPFDEDIILNTKFSNTIKLCSSLAVRDRVSRQCNTVGKITVHIHCFLTNSGGYVCENCCGWRNRIWWIQGFMGMWGIWVLMVSVSFINHYVNSIHIRFHYCTYQCHKTNVLSTRVKCNKSDIY